MNNLVIAEILAIVIGDMDLVRPLGAAGFGCAVLAHRGGPTRWSRYTRAVLEADEPNIVERIVELGQSCDEPPVLFYEADWSLQLVSERREELSEGVRFVVPSREHVQMLLSKADFSDLARRVDLPVPLAFNVRPRPGEPPPDDLPFPLIAKPVPGRDEEWDSLFGAARKAVLVEDPTALAQVWPRLAQRGGEALLQELVPGPESEIESYHAYVDSGGEIAAEFMGKKIRTFPIQFGSSCALETTHAADVRSAGRDFIEKTGFCGVMKADYKRRPDGSLALLEVNPRFSLWHSLGAAAGVNIPAFVMADLLGRPRPAPAEARAGATWCEPAADIKAARELGVSRLQWLRFLAGCDVRSAASLRDPLPFIRGRVLSRLLGGR